MEKEFNLKKEINKWADKWLHKKLTGRAYVELIDIENKFIKLLKEEIKGCEFPEIYNRIDKLAGRN